MPLFGKLGQDEGPVTGPPLGDGDSSVGRMVVGGTVVEGAPDELLDFRGQAASDEPLEEPPALRPKPDRR
jgi:hypothetical protein